MRQERDLERKESETDLVAKGNRLIARLDLYRSQQKVRQPDCDNISSFRRCIVVHSKYC